MASSHDDERPHLVASDLDGTLLRSDGSVSARTGEVWSALAGAGVETVVVTARPPRWLHHLSDIVGGTRDAHSVAICGNGAFVYDVADRVVLESHGFEPGVARGLVGDLLREFPNAGAAVETDRGMYRTRAYPDQHVGEPGHDTGVGDVTDCELAELPDDLVVGKILIRDEAWSDDAFVADVTQCLGERGVLAYSGAGGLAEISAPGVTKAVRLEAWCLERGIGREEVWAFGDMPNDLPMLDWAGRGVAVANAHEDVLAAADDRCAANDEDGVAEYLARRLL